MSEVSVALTSCGRPDLLKQTIESFLKFNSHPIVDFFVIEDKNEKTEEVKKIIKNFSNVKLLITDERVGQAKAIEQVYTKIKTKYIFHCEDDWNFHKSGFIEKSIPILESDPKILQVHVRAPNEINGHPVSQSYLIDDIKVRRLAFNYLKVWHGFSWNPGLRRKDDLIKEDKLPNFKNECDFSIYYKELGFYVVVLDEKEGYVTHIGWNRHVEDPSL